MPDKANWECFALSVRKINISRTDNWIIIFYSIFKCRFYRNFLSFFSSLLMSNYRIIQLLTNIDFNDKIYLCFIKFYKFLRFSL